MKRLVKDKIFSFYKIVKFFVLCRYYDSGFVFSEPTIYAENRFDTTDWILYLFEMRLRTGMIYFPYHIAVAQSAATLLKKTDKKLLNCTPYFFSFETHVGIDSDISIVSCIHSELDTKNMYDRSTLKCSNKSIYVESLYELDEEFDVVISIDYLQRIEDYCFFLQTISRLSKAAILTFDNKGRNYKSMVSMHPEDHYKYREWTAGEGYWILKCFYKKVQLFQLKDECVPELVPASFLSRAPLIIAYCEN